MEKFNFTGHGIALVVLTRNDEAGEVGTLLM